MILNHLRRNVVAYLALIVAVSTGTAYAAGLADGSVTTKKLAKNSVTSAKIKKGGVRSADLLNNSVGVADLKDGLVWVGGKNLADGANPAAMPDSGFIGPYTFKVPRAGMLQVTMSSPGMVGDCSGSSGHVGLYLDKAPIPGTRVSVGSSAVPVGLVGLLRVAAGPHTVTYGFNCTSGIASYDLPVSYYSLALGE